MYLDIQLDWIWWFRRKNGENVYNPLQLKAILNCMYIVRNTVRQDLAKKIGKTFIAHCGMRVNKQQESSSTTRRGCQPSF